MNRLLIVLALFLLPALATAVLAMAPAPPEPEADSLWVYITKTDPYQKWGMWPDYQGLQPARSPHRPLNRVYVNRTGLKSEKPPVDYGTIEVKETVDQDGKLRNITVQYKARGYNPADGDWFWAMYDADGKVMKQGKLQGCIGCHRAAKGNDYIMVHNF